MELPTNVSTDDLKGDCAIVLGPSSKWKVMTFVLLLAPIPYVHYMFDKHPIISVLGPCVCWLWGIIAFWACFKKYNNLRMDKTGFVITRLKFIYHYKWSEITSEFIIIPTWHYFPWRLSEICFTATTEAHPRYSSTLSWNATYPYKLPENYEIGLVRLAALMNAYRNAALNSPPSTRSPTPASTPAPTKA